MCNEISHGHGCKFAKDIHWGSEQYLIQIGNNVQITSGVRFINHGGGWLMRQELPDFDAFGKIVIGDNVYIGNCAIILPGVTIASNNLIAAGSIVTKSTVEGYVYGGNPARKIVKLEVWKQNMKDVYIPSKKLKRNDKKLLLLSKEAVGKFIVK